MAEKTWRFSARFIDKGLELKALRDADSRKGAMCLFCVHIHKEKEKKMGLQPMNFIPG